MKLSLEDAALRASAELKSMPPQSLATEVLSNIQDPLAVALRNLDGFVNEEEPMLISQPNEEDITTLGMLNQQTFTTVISVMAVMLSVFRSLVFKESHDSTNITEDSTILDEMR